ncbi:MAG: BrnT family toxin [Roseiarcus sp.]
MKIEFDPAKRDWTLRGRGLDMARANEIFSGETLTAADDRRDYGEPRNLTIGFLDDRMVVVVWTPRAGAFRIVSLRKANAREQALYGPRFSRRRP